MSGPRTGYAHPSCFGQVTNDCSSDITKEHPVSGKLLRVMEQVGGEGKNIIIGGRPWQNAGDEKAIGIPGLSSKILCARHNEALSPLDNSVSDIYKAISKGQLELVTASPGDSTKKFTLCSGKVLELWLLKALWGQLASGVIHDSGKVVKRFAPEIDTTLLAEILWRGAPWPDRWGLYARVYDPQPNSWVGSLATECWDKAGLPWGASFRFTIVQLDLALGVPDFSEYYRPGLLVLRHTTEAMERLIALAWPDEGHGVLTYRQGNNEPPRADA